MTLQDKISKLRKKNGWSQEDLADKLYVTRQAVSKWESGQSLPDVEKIVHMSKLFGVTTDYLLNEEIEAEDVIEESVANDNKILEQDDVDAYLRTEKTKSIYYAISVCLMLFSPVIYMILKLVSVENYALIGGIVAAVLLALGISIYFIADARGNEYKYINKGAKFTLGYGVNDYVTEMHKSYQKIISRQSFVLILICILDALVLTLFTFLYKVDSMITSIATIVTFVLLSAAGPVAVVFYSKGISMRRLLKQGDYAPENLARTKIIGIAGSILSVCALTGCSIYGYITEDWGRSIAIFVGGGLVLWVIIEKIIRFNFEQKKNKISDNKELEQK